MATLNSRPEDVLAANIQRLEDNKASLLREIDVIDKQLALERAAYTKLRNEKSPLYQLPNEVLVTILTMVHDSFRFASSPKGQQHALSFLLATSQVSARLRETILNTPLFWNEIVMTFRQGFTPAGGPLADYLEAQLTRSGDCYLDMVFHLLKSTGYPAFLQLIGRHSKRWRRVSFLITVADVKDFRKAFEGLDTPILEHFSINIESTLDGGPTSPRAAYEDVSPAVFTHGAPKLKFLRLAGAGLGNLHPHSTAIQTLHLDGWSRSYLSWTQLKMVLESLPQLLNLSLQSLCIRHPRDPLEHPMPLEIPTLRQLRIREPYTHVDRILFLMSLPNLEHLYLQHVETFDSAPIPSLTSLFLESCPLDFQHIGNMQMAFPSMETLSVDECSYAIYTMLNPDDEEPNVDVPWRRLHTLTVRQLTPADVVHLFAMVRTRETVKAPLRKVRLDRRSRNVLRLQHRLDAMSEHVAVENCAPFESWPLGLGYDDPHDLEGPSCY